MNGSQVGYVMDDTTCRLCLFNPRIDYLLIPVRLPGKEGFRFPGKIDVFGS